MTEAEFSEFVASTKAVVLAAIRRNLNPALSHAIDDVAQESYLRAYRFLQKNGRDALRADQTKSWIYTIARNESRRMNQRHGREDRNLRLAADRLPPPGSASPADDTPGDAARSTIDALETFETFETIESIAGDDRQLRAILEMKAQAYRVREIAVSLNIPEGTIKSRLARLRQRLRAAAKPGGAPQ